ncbi:MAG: hypothetical protein NDI75_15950, partial [Candidatus Didemnitutus sp.]|nr:hypothetical protein [Candidatus Didemnitutus sp.]
YTRFRRWRASGLFAAMLRVLSKRARGVLRHLDCSHIKLHHGSNLAGGQSAQAMGRTNGGLNTKLAALVDRHGRALAVSLAAGRATTSKQLSPCWLRHVGAASSPTKDLMPTLSVSACTSRKSASAPVTRNSRPPFSPSFNSLR